LHVRDVQTMQTMRSMRGTSGGARPRADLAMWARSRQYTGRIVRMANDKI
jgi:hypothetical protein